MKITQSRLKQIIKEELEGEDTEQPAAEPESAITKKVGTATTSGGMMDAEQYLAILKKVLLSPKVSAQVRKEALVAVFGEKGTAINNIILQMLKAA